MALPTGLAFDQPQCVACEVSYKRRYAGAALLASRDMVRHGSLTGYVLAGPQVMVEHNSFVVSGGSLTVSNSSQVPLPPVSTRWSAGALGGLGFTVRRGPLHLFVEQQLSVPAVLGVRTTSRTVTYPLQVGVLF